MLTDLINGVSYDPATRLGVSNLLEILSYFDYQRRTGRKNLRNLIMPLIMPEFKPGVMKINLKGVASISINMTAS